MQLPRHAGVLRAAAGQKEDHGPWRRDYIVDHQPARIGRPQGGDRIRAIARGENGATIEGPAPLGERIGCIVEPKFGVDLKRVGEPLRVCDHRLAAASGQRQQDRLILAAFCNREGLIGLENGMRIRSADAERIDGGAAAAACLRPGQQPVGDAEGALVEGDGRVRLFEAERRRDLAMLEGQHRLDQADDAGRRVQMADIALDRPDIAAAVRPARLAERLGQRLDFDRVAQIGARAMAFDVVDRIGGDAGHAHGLDRRTGLARDARCKIAGLLTAIIVDGRGLDDRVDHVTVGDGIGQALEHHHASAAAEDGAGGPMVERPAMAVGRKDLAFLGKIAAAVRLFDGDAAGQRRVTFAVEQALAGLMHRDERGGAGSLDGHARAAQVEGEGDARRQKILVVAGVAQQEHADIVDQLLLAAEIEVEVAAHAAAGKDADRPVLPVRHQTGIFHRRPGAFQEVAMLRIHDRGIFRAHAKEIGVEHFHVGQFGRARNIVRPVDQLRRFATRLELLAREGPDGLHALFEVVPKRIRRRRAGDAQRHANDRNITGRGIIHRTGHHSPTQLQNLHRKQVIKVLY